MVIKNNVSLYKELSDFLRSKGSYSQISIDDIKIGLEKRGISGFSDGELGNELNTLIRQEYLTSAGMQYYSLLEAKDPSGKSRLVYRLDTDTVKVTDKWRCGYV